MRRLLVLVALLSISACVPAPPPPSAPGSVALARLAPIPAPAPPRWQGLIGSYARGSDTLLVFEDEERLQVGVAGTVYPLEEAAGSVFRFPNRGPFAGQTVFFERNETGRATGVAVGSVVFPRRDLGTEDGATFRIDPIRPVEELRREALAATPPLERGPFREPDLVDLSTLDPTFRFDIRYATANNFMGTPFYAEPKAFLQRPAAEALLRAQQTLQRYGYGLLIHDAYRPWYVTRMFWDATPDSLKEFVANPANGSRHNRGAAVDLTLYNLRTGEPVEMPSGYDEFTPRAYPGYPGGTALERWHRELLRQAMEAQGFTVYENEWWHFDYRDWREYPIGNVTFEEIAERP